VSEKKTRETSERGGKQPNVGRLLAREKNMDECAEFDERVSKISGAQ